MRPAHCPARRTSQTLVPGAGHLVHMPTHIYMRLGMWEPAVEHNIQAVAVDEKFIEDRHPGGVYPMGYYPHNLDVMLAALCMLGRGSEAIATARKIVHRRIRRSGAASATARGRSSRSRSIRSRASAAGTRSSRSRHRLPDSATSPACGTTRAGSPTRPKGQYDSAAVELDSVTAIGPTLPADLPASLNPASSVLAIAEHHLRADLASRQGRRDEAMAEFRKGIALEDELTYDEPAGWYLPLRQPLGALLLAAGRPKNAEREYRADLVRFPHNGWSLHGLEQSLRAQQRTREADAVAKELKEVWAKADVVW